MKHPPLATDPGVRDRTLPQSTPLIDTGTYHSVVFLNTRTMGHGTLLAEAQIALAEALTRWLDLPTCVACGVPFDHGCNIAVCSEACRGFVEDDDEQDEAMARSVEREAERWRKVGKPEPAQVDR